MIYTTFEQIEYGFVLLDINKKHLDINRFRKYKIERFGLNRPLQCGIGPILADLYFHNLFLIKY